MSNSFSTVKRETYIQANLYCKALTYETRKELVDKLLPDCQSQSVIDKIDSFDLDSGLHIFMASLILFREYLLRCTDKEYVTLSRWVIENFPNEDQLSQSRFIEFQEVLDRLETEIKNRSRTI